MTTDEVTFTPDVYVDARPSGLIVWITAAWILVAVMAVVWMGWP